MPHPTYPVLLNGKDLLQAVGFRERREIDRTEAPSPDTRLARIFKECFHLGGDGQ